MNHEEVKDYRFFREAGCVQSCYKNGIHLNNDPCKVAVVKGNKGVHVVTKGEKVEKWLF